LRRRRLQQKASKKPSLRKFLAKYSKREENRAKDFIHKLTAFIAGKFKGYIHGFEHLGKNRMLNSSKEHNRNISKSDWRTIITFMSCKSKVVLLNPKTPLEDAPDVGWLMPRREHHIYAENAG
jgi:putative transposase